MTLNEIDIGRLIYRELTELKDAIEVRMEEMRREGVPALRERFAEEAAALGVTLEEVVSSNKARRGRPRKPHPEAEEVETGI